MLSIRKIHFDAFFEDSKLCLFLEILNVGVEELKKIKEDVMLRGLEEMSTEQM